MEVKYVNHETGIPTGFLGFYTRRKIGFMGGCRVLVIKRIGEVEANLPGVMAMKLSRTASNAAIMYGLNRGLGTPR